LETAYECVCQVKSTAKERQKVQQSANNEIINIFIKN